MIKFIVSDMDGTLLSLDGLSEYTKQVLLLANKEGIRFAVATGRDYSGIKSIFENTGIEYSAILGNGAFETRKIVEQACESSNGGEK